MSNQERSFEELVQRLAPEVGLNRGGAARELARRSDPRAIEPLYAALQQRGPEQDAIAVALCQLGDERGLDYLLQSLETWPDSSFYLLAPELAALRDRRAIKPLLKALERPMPDSYDKQLAFVRIVEALGQLGPAPETSEKLLQLVRENHRYGRNIAACILGELNEQRAVEPLLTLLQNPHETSPAIVEALGLLRATEAVELLLKKLKAKGEHYRANVVEALGRIGDVRAVESLLKLAPDRSPYVGYALAVALGRIGDPRALSVLSAMQEHETRSYRIRDRHFSVKEAAASAIAQIQAQTQGLHAQPPDPALTQLKSLPDEQLWPLLADPDPRLRAAAAEEVGERRSHPDALEPLLSALQDPVPTVRRSVVYALSQQDAQVASQALVAALTDASSDVRLRAIKALTNVSGVHRGAPGVLEGIVARLADEEPEVQQVAAEALAELNNKRTVEPLIALLQSQLAATSGRWNDSHVKTCLAAIKTLGDLVDAQAVPALVEALNQPTITIASEAAEVLGRMRDPSAVAPLRRRLDSLPEAQEELRHPLLLALYLLDDPRGREWMNHSRLASVPSAVSAPAYSAAASTTALLRQLRTGSSTERYRAAQALAAQKDHQAVEPLIALILDEEQESSVRRAAAEVLASIGDHRALPALQSLLGPEDISTWELVLRDEEVLAEAITALGQLGDTTRIDRIIWVLEHDAWEPSMAAAEALARLNDPRAIVPLANLLSSRDEDYAVLGVYGLAEMNHSETIAPLLQALSDPTEVIREVAASGLSKYSTSEVRQALVAALADDTADVAKAAAEALGRCGNAETLEQLYAIEPSSEEHAAAVERAIEAIEAQRMKPD